MPTTQTKNGKQRRFLDRLGILEEIRQLKDGMHTPWEKIDGDGVDLFRGQWQKIAIARGAASDAGCSYWTKLQFAGPNQRKAVCRYTIKYSGNIPPF